MISSRTLARTLVGTISRPLQSSIRSTAGPALSATHFRSMSLGPQNTHNASADQQPQQFEGYESLDGFQLRPASPSYFTTNPVYNELIVNLDYTYRQFRPVSKPSKQAVRPNWLGKEALRTAVGVDALKTSQYRLIVSKLNQLATLTPRPAPVDVFFARFSKPEEHSTQKAKPRVVDHLGRALATGRRKEASASVYVVEGDGKVLINGEEGAQYFKKTQDLNSLLKPFEVTNLLGKYNVWALVKGGGTTGQAEAISLGIAKALMTHSPELKPTLRKAGCITRDMRVVERKKPGQYGAREKFQWVKR
ncbi:37S ribosomal protein S9, mitochondrial [Dissophora globulifera]|uniref:Small ribosomal subunit protein uS9m n=1 Tax=Dissophora globulifera TaxID=979702 RepID=A0A9P6RWU5_9FUNG|nr:37S ribosomal protein S9, mitochondrial [Dissophora globulifera]KAG0328558.1 37S ribosomal protein S9, mitochondrial [Dissophora globulifera]